MSDITKESVRKKREVPNLISRDQYFRIWGFMRYDLRLEKAELLIYALIFNYYITRGESYVGSREYISEWCGCGKTALDDALRNLCKKEYIIKDTDRVGNVIRTSYRINPRALPECEMFNIEKKAIEVADELERQKLKEKYDI